MLSTMCFFEEQHKNLAQNILWGNLKITFLSLSAAPRHPASLLHCLLLAAPFHSHSLTHVKAHAPDRCPSPLRPAPGRSEVLSIFCCDTWTSLSLSRGTQS